MTYINYKIFNITILYYYYIAIIIKNNLIKILENMFYYNSY